MSEKDFWEGYVPEPVKSGEGASATVTITLPAQQALDKKAENARELGLDYEPVCNKDPQGCWNVRCQLGKKCKNTSAQRTWVGLSEEEVTLCHSLAVLSKKHDGTDPSFTTLLHQQIEAKLRSKNEDRN